MNKSPGNKRNAMVSVIVPTLNAIRFLEERIGSLRKVTYGVVEFICVDSGSTDGTRERLEAWARADRRVRIVEAPRGLYLSLNIGIRETNGEYVYIATADDTCVPEIFDRMVSALEAHPECDLCDSRLQEVDAAGSVLEEGDAEFLPCFGHLVYPRDREHVRKAPYDFILHCSGKTVYTSLTQILVRRKVFDNVGFFPEDQGPSADYLWGMRVSAKCNAVYLPERLATWRVHEAQLTGHERKVSNFDQMQRMGRLAIAELPDGELRHAAECINRVVELKTDLLPIKRRAGMLPIVRGVVHATCCHPRKLALLIVSYVGLRMSGCGSRCVAVHAYDRVFRHVAGDVLRELRDWD